MIYLIKSAAFDENDNYITILKIGYAKEVDKRYNQYVDHNPTSVLLKTREGDKTLESYLHRYFKKYKFPKKREWFYYSQEIVDNFENIKIDNSYTIDELKAILYDSSDFSSKDKKYRLSIIESFDSYYFDGKLSEFDYKFYKSKTFEERMKIICEEYEKNPGTDIFNYISSEYRDYIDTIGIKEIKKSNYKKFRLDPKVSKVVDSSNDLLDSEIYKIFKEGEKFTLSDIKTKIGDILRKLNITSITPKASMIKKYFEVKRVSFCQPKDENGIIKKIDGYELLNKLD